MYNNLTETANALIPIFIVIFLGWIAAKRNIIPSKYSKILSTLVLNFTFPCLLFYKTATTSPSEYLNGRFIIAFGLALVGMYFLTFFLNYKVFKKELKVSTLSTMACSFPDMAFMGIPILSYLIGGTAVVAIAIGNIFTSLIFIPVTVILLDHKREQSKGQLVVLINNIKYVLKKPLVIAPILGTVFSLLNIHIPGGVMRGFNLMGSATSSVSLFTLGLIVAAHSLKINKEILCNVFMKNIIHPVLAIALVILFGVTGHYARELILLCAMPSAVMVSMFAINYDTYTEDSAGSIVVGTLVSIVTLGFFIMITGMFEF